MSQIMEYESVSELESSDSFLLDGNEGTRIVPLSALSQIIDNTLGITAAKQVLSAADLNSASDGMHYFRDNCTNKPGETAGVLIQATYDTTIIQVAFTFDGKAYTRQSSSSGTWSAWALVSTEETKIFSLSGTTLTITDGVT